MGELNEILNLGIDINFGLIILIVIVSSKVIQFLKKRNKGKGNYKTVTPLAVGMILVMLYSLLTKHHVAKADVWVAIVHSIMASGSYAFVKSFLKKKGMKL